LGHQPTPGSLTPLYYGDVSHTTIHFRSQYPEETMKTDLQLQQDVSEELRWDPSLDEKEIAIAVKDGVVTLRGVVDSYAAKVAAGRAAERVSGVRALADELAVRLPGEHTRSDTEIAHAVANALGWDVVVPRDHITAAVESGWVTLRGEVNWQYQRAAAERAVRYLTGVKGVSNLITIAPLASSQDIKSRIENALKRSAELDAGRITVEAMDSKVTLKGTVRSWVERRDAERAAWAAPGVKEVDDRLTVSAI
jgi:osmotically-inducible protein OsmY